MCCGEPAIEGDVEGIQGCLPADGPAGLPLAGRVQRHDRHVDALQGGLLVREVAVILNRSSNSRVHGLDGVRGAEMDGEYWKATAVTAGITLAGGAAGRWASGGGKWSKGGLV